MKLKVFTLRYSDAAGGFDDTPLQEFLSAREVIEVTDHFFVHERTPCLLMVVSYRDVEADEERHRRPNQRSERSRTDPRDDLDDGEKKVYDALRTWRTARAQQDGVPPYVVANNRQLARMVRLRVDSKTALLKVVGFGEEKVRHYGDGILDVLGRLPPTDVGQGPGGDAP